MSIKVSIIVPVYNTSEYLPKCLDSLVKQSLGSIEILAVDNNSSDDSYKIIQQYAKKYKTIRPLFCKKAGVSAARNMGMKSAKGEFLAFCDSDDYAELNMCEELYKQAKESESDLVVCDYYLDNQDGNMQPVSCGLENRSSNIKKNYLSSITVAPWNKLIKRSLIIDNKLFFEEGIIYEDLGVVPAYILYAKKCSYVKRPLYHYVCRADSIINSGRKPNADIFVAIDSLYDIFLRNNAVEKYHAELEFIFIRHLLHNAASRYLPHRELREDNLKRIREIMRGKFPGWRKNVYYATMPGRYKLLCFMIYTGTHWVLLVGSYIKKMIRS